MILATILIALYIIIGAILGVFISIDEKGLQGWDWFWIIVGWLPCLLIVIIELIVDYFRLKRK